MWHVWTSPAEGPWDLYGPVSRWAKKHGKVWRIHLLERSIPPKLPRYFSFFWSLAFSRLANCLLFNGPKFVHPFSKPWDVCLSESKMLQPSQEAAKDQKLMLSQKPLEEEVEVQMPESNDQKEEIGI